MMALSLLCCATLLSGCGLFRQQRPQPEIVYKYRIPPIDPRLRQQCPWPDQPGTQRQSEVALALPDMYGAYQCSEDSRQGILRTLDQAQLELDKEPSKTTDPK